MSDKYLDYQFVQNNLTLSPTCREIINLVIKNAQFFKGMDSIRIIINLKNENVMGEINVNPHRKT